MIFLSCQHSILAVVAISENSLKNILLFSSKHPINLISGDIISGFYCKRDKFCVALLFQVIQRQENLAHKQQEIRAEMERKKAEAEEEKAKTRRRKARLAAEAARRRSPGAYSDDERERGGGGADGR